MSEPLPVLLVDDDTALYESLSQLFKMDAVTAVHDGEFAVRQALSGTFEIVVLDVMLPALDGRKVLRRIRFHSQIPVIMLTARGDDAERIAGLEAGADDHLPKPFNPPRTGGSHSRGASQTRRESAGRNSLHRRSRNPYANAPGSLGAANSCGLFPFKQRTGKSTCATQPQRCSEVNQVRLLGR
jgi:CheY-like chemotaxis protein